MKRGEREAGHSIILQTHDENKVLTFASLPDGSYDKDLHFAMRVASGRVSAVSQFQVSEGRLDAFVRSSQEPEATLFDENGDASIKFEATDSIGHYLVTVEVGGPWSDQAKISFQTDQTAIREFVRDLEMVLKLRSLESRGQ